MYLPVSKQARFAFMLCFTFLTAASAHAAHHFGMGSVSGKALGVGVSELSSEVLSSVKLEHGVRVERTIPGSPAEAAGLQQGDIIVELLGKPVYSVERLQWLVSQAPEATPVDLHFQRGDALEKTTVEFHRMQATAKPRPTGPRGHGRPMAFLGVQIQPMTPQLRSAFGAAEDAGVLVTSIVEGSPADRAGLAVGDIIVRMDRKTIHRIPDLYRVLRYFDPGESIEVEVVRGKASETFTAQLAKTTWHKPSKPRHHGMSEQHNPTMPPTGT